MDVADTNTLEAAAAVECKVYMRVSERERETNGRH